MEKLKQDWITEGLIDFEYKKYQLLAYLKRVRKQFDNRKLYPELSELLMHFRNLQQIKEEKKLIFEHFPKRISRIDFEKLKLSYQQIVDDDEVMKEIYEVINFAMPQLKEVIRSGKELYESVEDRLELEVIGLLPIYDNEGYLFLGSNGSKDLLIYRYRAGMLESADEKFRTINTQFMGTETRGLVNTLEHIKLKLIRQYQDMPNPATYMIHSKGQFPVQETLLPIAKRILIRNLRFAA